MTANFGRQNKQGSWQLFCMYNGGRRDGEKDILGLGRWQKVALGQLEGFHTEVLLTLTYLSTGLWLWIASYGRAEIA